MACCLYEIRPFHPEYRNAVDPSLRYRSRTAMLRWYQWPDVRNEVDDGRHMGRHSRCWTADGSALRHSGQLDRPGQRACDEQVWRYEPRQRGGWRWWRRLNKRSSALPGHDNARFQSRCWDFDSFGADIRHWLLVVDDRLIIGGALRYGT